MLSVVMLSVPNKTHMLSVGMLSVILPSVVAPKVDFDCAIDDDLQIEKKNLHFQIPNFIFPYSFSQTFQNLRKNVVFSEACTLKLFTVVINSAW